MLPAREASCALDGSPSGLADSPCQVVVHQIAAEPETCSVAKCKNQVHRAARARKKEDRGVDNEAEVKQAERLLSVSLFYMSD